MPAENAFVPDHSRTYIAIDLKSFYASVECVERKLNPLLTNLVVADASRTEKTICLAVSPSLKAYGISGRARLFEVVQRVKEVNALRFSAARRKGLLPRGEDGKMRFTSSSFDAEALSQDPALELGYITAPPQMRLYEEYSARIYGIYLKYIAPEDIHVYSIDEVFMDVTKYLDTYRMTAHELAMTMIREVLYETGITATAGIGTNLYLAKVAMDIVAKHVPADKDGVRIASLDERSYREQLWTHQPLTDFWRVGRGYARKLQRVGIRTMGDIAQASLYKSSEDLLYNLFGVNAELLIDHAWGWEPCTMEAIKAYRPSQNSISSGQVLHEPYTFEKGELIVREMTELLALDLVRHQLVTRQLVLTVGYDRESLAGERGEKYRGPVEKDFYGRKVPKAAHGAARLERYSSSAKKLVEAMLRLYRQNVDPSLLIRRVIVAAGEVIRETDVPEEGPEQLSFFADIEETDRQRQEDRDAEEKEKRIQRAVLQLQEKYGKNAVLKGMNLLEGGTTMQRNQQIGGHRA